MDLTVIIVAYNTRERLLTSLARLLPELVGLEHEVIVVDNASQDGSVPAVRQRFPQVTVLSNSENVGFARANNRALRQAQGVDILLLNPDTEIQPGAVARLRSALGTLAGAVAVGPKILRPDGRLDLASRRSFPHPAVAFARLIGLSRAFPRSRLVARYNRTYEDPDQPGEIDAGTAAAMLFQHTSLAAIDYFDEAFFMYGEDLDLCLRLKQHGGRIYYEPSAVVIHHKGESSRQEPRAMLREFHHAMWIFYRKHYAHGWLALLSPVIWMGIQMRYGLVLGWNALRKQQVVSP